MMIVITAVAGLTAITFGVPWLFIWALNELFNLGVPWSPKTWFAVIVLFALDHVRRASTK